RDPHLRGTLTSVVSPEHVCLALLLVTVGALTGAPCGAQQPDGVRGDTPVATAQRTTGTIHVDGRLDEPDWQRAPPVGPLPQLQPPGARPDRQVADNAESLSRDCEGISDAAVTRTTDGWTAELSIPFKTLRFRPDQTIWGLNVERQIKHLFETDRWAAARVTSWIGNLADAGQLTGLEGARQGRGLDVRPYVSGGRDTGNGEFTGGLDVFKNLTPNLNASITVNTDFAETEADIRQVNLTRFP